MTNLLSMTFHESYGDLPTALLKTYKRFNVPPAEHDQILAAFGLTWQSPVIPWADVLDFVLAHVENGQFRLPLYL